MQEMLTGVVTADGVVPFAAEVLNDLRHGRGIGRQPLPVVFERTDPKKIVVLWEEVAEPDFTAGRRTGRHQHTAQQPIVETDELLQQAAALEGEERERGVKFTVIVARDGLTLALSHPPTLTTQPQRATVCPPDQGSPCGHPAKRG